MVKNWKNNFEFNFRLFTITQYVVLHQMIELYVKSLENPSQILIKKILMAIIESYFHKSLT
jgi:hypothetical protein